MNRDLLEAAYKLEITGSLEKLWRIIVDVMSLHGLHHVLYLIRDDGPAPNWFVLSNLLEDWPKDDVQNPAFREPFVSYCCATFEPTKLGVEFLEQHRDFIDDYTRTYVANMARFNWTIGLGIPCCLVGSGQHGGFLFGNDMKRHDFERGVMPLADQLQAFCQIAHRKIESLRRTAASETPRRRLSAREHQVLELIACGLRPKAIADQLGLSEASIRLYIKNARLKLGAATKEEALIRFLKLCEGSNPD